jgi:hypothetical protein
MPAARKKTQDAGEFFSEEYGQLKKKDLVIVTILVSFCCIKDTPIFGD